MALKILKSVMEKKVRNDSHPDRNEQCDHVCGERGQRKTREERCSLHFRRTRDCGRAGQERRARSAGLILINPTPYPSLCFSLLFIFKIASLSHPLKLAPNFFLSARLRFFLRCFFIFNTRRVVVDIRSSQLSHCSAAGRKIEVQLNGGGVVI